MVCRHGVSYINFIVKQTPLLTWVYGWHTIIRQSCMFRFRLISKTSWLTRLPNNINEHKAIFCRFFYLLQILSLKFYAIVHCGIKDTSTVRVCPGCFRSLSIGQVQAHCPDQWLPLWFCETPGDQRTPVNKETVGRLLWLFWKARLCQDNLDGKESKAYYEYKKVRIVITFHEIYSDNKNSEHYKVFLTFSEKKKCFFLILIND